MLTGSEKRYFALTAVFLLTGTGIKAYRHAFVTLGPLDAPAENAAPASTAQVALRPDSGTPPPSQAPAPGPDSSASAAAQPSEAGHPEASLSGPGPESRKAHPAASKAVAGPVSLNQAGYADLMTVKGIGEKTALAILEYRKTHGRFRNLEELRSVKGIGEKKLEKMRPFLLITP